MKKIITLFALVLLTFTSACVAEQTDAEESVSQVEDSVRTCSSEIDMAYTSDHCVVVFETSNRRSTRLDNVCTRNMHSKFSLVHSKDGCARLIESDLNSGESVVHGSYCPSACPAHIAVCEEGDTQMADDGCNTCACVNGGWACTKKGCQNQKPVCEKGETMPADDGCNTCQCVNGGWACTKMACQEPVCEEGETVPADDGCNTCTCDKGQWQCTIMYCGDDGDEAVCEDGDTQPAGNKCGEDAECTCINGQWSCPKDGC